MRSIVAEELSKNMVRIMERAKASGTFYLLHKTRKLGVISAHHEDQFSISHKTCACLILRYH